MVSRDAVASINDPIVLTAMTLIMNVLSMASKLSYQCHDNYKMSMESRVKNYPPAAKQQSNGNAFLRHFFVILHTFLT